MSKETKTKRNTRFSEKKRDDFEQEIIDIARVTRVMGGGKRMSFRACVIIGDKKGQIGLGVKKGPDVTAAIQKAVTCARKKLIRVEIVDGTIPHGIIEKFGAARVMLKPAQKGRGVIAGGPVRAVLETAGVKDVVSKMMGSKNKINNAWATLNALKKQQTRKAISDLRS